MPEFEADSRLHHDLLSDYHCHCDYSIDAVGSIDEYCESAIAKGLVELCFTTHFDANPRSDQKVNLIRVDGKDLPATVDNLSKYVDDVRAAHDKYFAMGLSVKLGLEFGWYPGCEEQVLKLKERYPFEYMLCGIHELDDLCFCCKRQYADCFERYSVEQAAELYFEYVVQAASSGLFDTIAHLDYYKKYGLEYYGDSILKAHEPFMDRVFETLKESHTCLEINTAALRNGLNSYFPSLEFIHAAKRAGVDVQFLASDAHKPEDVGYDFDMIAPLIGQTVSGCED